MGRSAKIRHRRRRRQGVQTVDASGLADITLKPNTRVLRVRTTGDTRLSSVRTSKP